MEDDLVAFRAGYPSARDAIAKCDRPTWAIRLAFDDATDRRAVIRTAVLTARRLLPKENLIDFINPVPKPLDVVELWSGTRSGTRMRAGFKSFGIAILLVSVSVVLVRTFVLAEWLEKRALNEILMLGAGIVAVYVVARPVEMWLRRAVEREASRLDEHRALTIVLDQISKGLARNPDAATAIMSRLQFTLGELLDQQPQ